MYFTLYMYMYHMIILSHIGSTISSIALIIVARSSFSQATPCVWGIAIITTKQPVN